MRLMRDSGTVSIGPNLAKSTEGIAGSAAASAGGRGRQPAGARLSAARTSSRVMRPFSPRALDQVEIEIEFAGEPAHRGTGEDAGKVRLCRPGRRDERWKGGLQPAPGAREASGGRRRRQAARGAAAWRGRSRGGGLSRRRFNARDEATHRHFVADLADDLGDRAGDRRGDVHGRLVGFQRHQRLVDLDDVPRLHQHLDDGDVLEVADNREPSRRSSPPAPSQAQQVEFGIASLQLSRRVRPVRVDAVFGDRFGTRRVGSNCSSASAFRPATATW